MGWALCVCLTGHASGGLPRQLRGPERTGLGVAGTPPVGTDVSVLTARRREVCAGALTRESRDIHGVSRPTRPSLLAVAAASSAQWQGRAVAVLALLCPVPRPSARTHWFTLPVEGSGAQPCVSWSPSRG